MLPRLKAEERLDAINDGAISAGTMELADQRTVIRTLQQEARRAPPRPPKAKPHNLAEMGIAVRLAEAPAKEPLSDG
jgi:hypothetical protein